MASVATYCFFLPGKRTLRGMRTKIEGDSEAWQRVARELVARRSALGLTQEELAEASTVSATTIRYLETAAKSAYRALTLARVAEALDWRASRFTELLAGSTEEVYEVEALDDDDRERLAELEAAVLALTAKVDAIYDRLVRPAPRPAPKRARSPRPPQ